MMKTILKAMLFFFAIFIFGCKKNLPLEKLSDDMEISSSLKNIDLCRYTIFMNRGGVLENIVNGKIVISESVGADTVILKNCRDVDVVVRSKANILLDDRTSI